MFTFPLGFVQPEPVSCLIKINASTAKLETPEVIGVLNKREAPNYFEVDELPPQEENIILPEEEEFAEPSGKSLFRSKRAIPKPPPGISPLKVTYAENYKKGTEQDSWISPSFSSQVFKRDDVKKVP